MIIKVFATKNFLRWAKKESISSEALLKVVDELEQGLSHSSLGSGLVKKRVAKNGAGKRGGYRVLLAFKGEDRTVFLFGFSKNDRENIDNEEKHIYRKLSQIYLGLSLKDLNKLCIEKKLYEVNHEHKKTR